ncbi:MAG: hypothetical protein AB3N24_23775 [Leisingera sp.]
MRDLRDGRHAHDLVLEAATVASLRDAVEAGFCQAFLPTSMAEGFSRAQSSEPCSTLQLTFCLITGPRFDDGIAAQVARKFRKVM